ncbi:MAG: isochorismatase family protein [Armatimonadota bacterium]
MAALAWRTAAIAVFATVTCTWVISAQEGAPVIYRNTLTRLEAPPPLLADYPRFVEPLRCEDRYLAPPVVDEPNADLTVRAWRYWYNARGIVEMENRLVAAATAIIVVHPWGIDDGHGMITPEPAGVAFFCTPQKNRICTEHIRRVLNPFLRRLRHRVGLVGYSMPKVEDDIRRLLYASIDTPPEALAPEEGERRLQEVLAAHCFEGRRLVRELTLDPAVPVRSYMQQTPSTDAGSAYNGEGYWDLPMPIHAALEREPTDLVFYDGEGYEKVRDFLIGRGIRHVLLAGYATDMCVVSTTCGYQNLSQDFNLFLVGDATLATYPASTTPRFATQVALHNAALTQLVTQVSWVRAD